LVVELAIGLSHLAIYNATQVSTSVDMRDVPRFGLLQMRI